MLAIQLPEDIELRLDNLALRTGRSKIFLLWKRYSNTLIT